MKLERHDLSHAKLQKASAIACLVVHSHFIVQMKKCAIPLVGSVNPCFMSSQINCKMSLHFTCFLFLFRFFLSRHSFSSRCHLITRMSYVIHKTRFCFRLFFFSTISICNSSQQDCCTSDGIFNQTSNSFYFYF